MDSVALVTFRVSGDIPGVSMTNSWVPCSTSGAMMALEVFFVGFFLLFSFFSALELFVGVQVLGTFS